MRYPRVFFSVMRIRGDVVVGTHPSVAMPGCLAAKLMGRRFIYYPSELYGCQMLPPSRALAWLERKMLSLAADVVITQNAERAKEYRRRGARVEPVIVHNYKESGTGVRPGRLRAQLELDPGARIVLYEGMIGQGRWLDRLALASLLLPPSTVMVFMGQQTPWWKDHSPEFAGEALTRGRLRVCDYVEHDALRAYVSDADVGVIIYDDNSLNNILCEPGKLSDYVLAGVPVVAPNYPTIAPVVRSMNIGQCFDHGSPEAISAAIQAVLDRGREHYREALEQAGKMLCWQTQAPNLLEAVVGPASWQSARQ